MDLFYESEGDGPPLVLLHGTGASWISWASVMPLLAPSRRAIAIDVPGFGASAPLPDGVTPSVPALAEAVGEWMREHDLAPAHVAGNSMGGGIALELAKRGFATSATAISPIGFYGRPAFAYGAASLRFNRIGARAIGPVAPFILRSATVRTLLFSQAMAKPWRMPADTAVALTRATATAPAFGAVVGAARTYRFGGAEPEIPMTIAWGARDRILFNRQARRAREALPGARFVPLPGCGHLPMTDDPELVAKVLLTA